MAQSWRVKPERDKKPRPPLDGSALERLALFYVGRYATTRAKLASYLSRKLRERGWSGDGEAPVEALVERFSTLGYLDDRGFASARAESLQRRGYGERRIAQALRAAGIEEADAADAREQSRAGAFAAALRFAERKRIGPFAAQAPDREAKQRAFAAMMRAGHALDSARRILDSRPGEVPESDSD
ncbi:MAG TPA: regulatory protein RecX [Allosphingosinicella sp.]|jgi:regulatory protein